MSVVYKMGVIIVQTLPPPPAFIKGGIDFLKFGNNGGDEIFVLGMEELD